MSGIEQRLGQMRTDEACAARNQDPHMSPCTRVSGSRYWPRPDTAALSKQDSDELAQYQF